MPKQIRRQTISRQAWRISNDIVSGFPLSPRVGTLLTILFFPPSLPFLFFLRRFDSIISKLGTRPAARWLLTKLYRGSRTLGQPLVTQGGTLYLCNHPGVADSLALFTQLNRGDLHIVVNDHWFFHSFKSFRKSFIFVDRNNSSPLVIRKILNHLKSGHGVILYPAGTIEPDPGVGNPGSSIFQNWSRVVGLLCGISQKQKWGFQIQTILTRGIFRAQDSNRPWIPPGLDAIKSSTYTIPEILFLGLARKRIIDLIILPSVESQFFLQEFPNYPKDLQFRAQQELIRFPVRC